MHGDCIPAGNGVVNHSQLTLFAPFLRRLPITEYELKYPGNSAGGREVAGCAWGGEVW